jgi:hypothetical protein
MARDLDDAKTGGRDDRAPKVSDIAQIFKFPPKKWVTMRLLPGLFPYAGYWVTVKKKDGGKTAFFTPCPSFDPDTQQRDSTKPDPWRDFEARWRAENPQDKKSKGDKGSQVQPPVRFAQEWYMDTLIRGEQKKLPSRMPKPTAAERKTGLKELDSDSITPIFGLKAGKSVVSKLQELKGLNVVEGKSGSKAYSVNDAKYGVDIKILHDGDKAPSDQYMIQAGETKTPLTEEELAYLRQPLEKATTIDLDPDAVQAEFEAWATRNGFAEFIAKKGKKKPAARDEDEDSDDEDEDADDEDEDDEPKSKKKAPAKKGKKVVDEDEDDFDDEDEDEDEDSDDDEDDEPPARSKKAPAKKGKKVVDEDDFDDEDDESDDEDEDEAPPPKKKPAKVPAKKSRKPVDEDDEDDDELDDDEDLDDDDSDDADEEDEDFDDEPKSKKKVTKVAPKKATKKPAKDEDDFDDEDEDSEEDDEEDEPKSKKKAPAKKVAPKKAAKKSSSRDDEDEDDFED